MHHKNQTSQIASPHNKGDSPSLSLLLSLSAQENRLLYLCGHAVFLELHIHKLAAHIQHKLWTGKIYIYKPHSR